MNVLMCECVSTVSVFVGVNVNVYVCKLIFCLLSHSLALTYISFIGCHFDASVMIFFERDNIRPPCA